ncbi:hypothetical protein GBAR_LOCUS28007 [Geodia barretti]|uniref:Uncharacterized protein n=1 Tax=Geodia barretti TaxID=519541 RepID=A0AA35TNH9_GEOBA|nr:hypothetical protein GBAR_LOCUS28007 [Geodia barretti]
MVISDLLMDPTIRTGDWRSVSTSATAQSVTMDLVQLKQQLHADNWGTMTARELLLCPTVSLDLALPSRRLVSAAQHGVNTHRMHLQRQPFLFPHRSCVRPVPM